jgi:NTP pyrophosphatase (non-canonical NTP hydrolase)
MNTKLLGNFTTISVNAHATAKIKGFWPNGERNLGEALGLVGTESAELLDAFQNRDKDNVAEEMADIVIRIADLNYGFGWKMERLFASQMNYTLEDDFARLTQRLADNEIYTHSYINRCLNIATDLFRHADPAKQKGGIEAIAELVIVLNAIAEIWDVDLYAAIENKMQFNTTRKFKHGKEF